jgi:DNA damage-inducible protein 1
LQRNVLVIKSADVETPFLPESELPHFARLNSYESMEEDRITETIKTSVQTSQPSTSQSASNNNQPEENIRQLMNLGYSRAESVDALTACGGDVSMAKIRLITKSLQVPGK